MAMVIVHGGAAVIAREEIRPHESACRRAVQRALEVLASGADATAAATAAVVVLEDDPVTNAGTGAVLNCDGGIELDALLMRGDLAIGAVVGVGDVLNPIVLARAILDLADVNVLAGHGASRFARSVGIDAVDPSRLITDVARERLRADLASGPHDTVGAVVRDDDGRTAAAVSTGGRSGKRLGRVGDTPLAGSGAWADDQLGAAVATGIGEDIMRVLLAYAALQFVEHGATAKDAATAAIALLERRVDGRAGVILIDAGGEPGIAFNTPQMSYAFGSSHEAITVGH